MILFMYRTRAIKSRDFIFLKTISLFLREACNQERLMMTRTVYIFQSMATSKLDNFMKLKYFAKC